jgi:hypothetical protein
MITKGNLMLCGVTAVILVAPLAACDSGPSEAEFVAACIKEGERSVANKALRKEAGVKGDAFCKCTAKEARTNLSADAQRAMILDMQGKKQEAGAISSKMSNADQMAFMQGATNIFGKCVGAR